MRPLELILLLLLAVSAGLVIVRHRPSSRLAGILAAGVAATTLLHLLLEGGRAQMTPLIVLLWGLASIPVWRGWSTPGEPRETGRVRAVFSGVLRFVLIPAACLLFAFLPAAIVVPELPTPTGSFAVGVTDFSVRFDDRPEVLSEDPGDSREILVRAWYPAERRRGDEAEPYFTKAEMQAFVETNSATIPGFGYLFSQAALARTHSVRDAPVAAQVDGFPVLAYSHGYGLFVSQNTPLMEELASHGYIVFGLGHTWDGSTVFPDGRTVGLGRHILALQDRAADPDYVREMTESVTMLSHGSSEAERRQALATQREAARRDRDEGLGTGLSAGVWLEDRRRFFDVLDDLQTGARPSPFRGRLDLSRIGLLGMSFGGATAVEACHREPRCGAAVNLDGGHWFLLDSDLLDGDVRMPMLMVHASDPGTLPNPSDANPTDYRAYSDFFYEEPSTRGTRDDVVRIRIEGTAHASLTDMALMVRWIPGLATETSGRRVAGILNRFVLAFFDEHLRGADSGLLGGPSPGFPEVSFQTFGRGAPAVAPAREPRSG